MCYSVNTVDKIKLLRNFDYKDGKLFHIHTTNEVGYVGSRGYLVTRFFGKQILVHRIIWTMHFGAIPEGLQIDHIDRDKSNNTLENLRLVTAAGNKQNQGLQTNNTSGHRGISWSKQDKHWFAYIYKDKKQHVLGCFKNFQDAVKARKDAEFKFQFLTCQI